MTVIKKVNTKDLGESIIKNAANAISETAKKAAPSIEQVISKVQPNNSETINLDLWSSTGNKNDLSIQEVANLNLQGKLEFAMAISRHEVTVQGVDLMDLTLLEPLDDLKKLNLNYLHKLDDNESLKALDNLSKQDIEELISILEGNQFSQNSTIERVVRGLKNYNYYRSDTTLTNDLSEKENYVMGEPDSKNDPLTPYNYIYTDSHNNSAMTPLKRMEAVAFALSQEGVTYNGDEKGKNGYWVDDIPNKQLTCNGLTRWSYKEAGITIPQGSIQQMRVAPIVTSDGKVSDITPGDIICYDYEGRVNRKDIDYNSHNSPTYALHHVGLYIGDGKMIESTPGHGVRIKEIEDYESTYTGSW